MAAQDFVEVTGMVISSMPVGDYNRRIVIISGEQGKITAFVRGARRPGNKFMGATEPFCFGTFKLIRGREAYNLTDVNVSRHFEELRTDYEGMIYGSYFMEIAEYYTRENLEAYEELNLLYASLLALTQDKFDRTLVRCIYELKSIVLSGEYPGIPNDRNYLDTTLYTVRFIEQSEIKKLYTFAVKKDVIDELSDVCDKLMKRVVGHRFKSIELLQSL